MTGKTEKLIIIKIYYFVSCQLPIRSAISRLHAVCRPWSVGLKLSAFRSPRKRNDVTDVGHARHELHHSLKSKSEARMRH